MAISISAPWAVAVGPDQSVYFTDQNNLKKIDSSFRVTTVATGFSFWKPSITPCNPNIQMTCSGSMNGNYPNGLIVGPDNTIYVTDNAAGVIKRIPASGIMTSVSPISPVTHQPFTLSSPTQVQLEPDSSLRVVQFPWSSSCPGVQPGQCWPATIISIASDGETSVLVGASFSPLAPPATTAPLVVPTPSLAQFSTIDGLAISDKGTVYVADRYNYQIRSINVDSSGNAAFAIVAGTTLGNSGDGGPASSAQLNEPHALALSHDQSTLFFTDNGNNLVRSINLSTGTLSTLNPSESNPSEKITGCSPFCFPSYKGIAVGALATAPDNSLYVLDNGGTRIRRVDVSGNTVSTVSLTYQNASYSLSNAMAMTLGPDGALYVTTLGSLKIARITQSGQITDLTASLCNDEYPSSTCPVNSALITTPMAVTFWGDDIYIIDGYQLPSVKRLRPIQNGTALNYAVSIFYGNSSVEDCVGSILKGSAASGTLDQQLQTSLASECPGRALALASLGCPSPSSTGATTSLAIGQAYLFGNYANGGVANVLEAQKGCSP